VGWFNDHPAYMYDHNSIHTYRYVISSKLMMFGLFMNFGEPVEKETIPDPLITYDRLIHLEMGHDSVDEKGPC